MKSNKKETQAKINYEVEVIRAKEINEGVVVFDLVCNGITIYGCWYREYVNKQGKDGTMISFPSRKGEDGEYYNHAWFPISKDLKNEIAEQLAIKVSE